MGKDVKKKTKAEGDNVREPSSKDINIGRFLDARAIELASLEEALKNKYKESNKTPMQSVPKHMRRRAMSHNRFRIPSRIRALNSKIMKDSEKKVLKNRKHARNSRLILLHYFKRSMRDTVEELPGFTKTKWMETHLWHARRFIMEEFQGYKIPIKCRQKQMKRTRVLSLSGTTMYDKSYYAMFEVEANQGLDSLLETICQIKSGAGKQVSMVWVDQEAGEALLIRTEETRAILVVLTSVQSHVENKITSYLAEKGLKGAIHVLNDSTNMFELIGPHSLFTLKKALRGILIEDTPKVLGNEHSLIMPIHIPSCSYFILKCQYGRERDLSDRHPDIENQIDEEPITTSGLQEVIKELTSQRPIGEFFNKVKNSNVERFLGRFWESRRGQYTHKRTKKAPEHELLSAKQTPTKVQEQKSSQPKSQIVNELTDPHPPKRIQAQSSQMDQEEITSSYELLKRIRQEELKPFEITVVNVSKRRENINRLMIFCPDGYGKRLWRKLVQSGAQPCGKVEYENVLHQMKQRVFPTDYPGSDLFKAYEETQKEKIKKVYLRRPPSKRVNFAKLVSPLPFSNGLDQILASSVASDSLLPITLRTLLSGVPAPLAYLCFPSEDDFKSLLRDHPEEKNRSMLKIMNALPSQIVEPINPEELLPYLNKYPPRALEIIDQVRLSQTSREVIGRLTSGFLLSNSAKGFGFGNILKSKLSQLNEITNYIRELKGAAYLKLPPQSTIVLFRNTTSRYYHFGLLTVDKT